MPFDSKQLIKNIYSPLKKNTKEWVYKYTTVSYSEMRSDGKVIRMLTISLNKFPDEEIKGMLEYFGFDLGRVIHSQKTVISQRYLQYK